MDISHKKRACIVALFSCLVIIFSLSLPFQPPVLQPQNRSRQILLPSASTENKAQITIDYPTMFYPTCDSMAVTLVCQWSLITMRHRRQRAAGLCLWHTEIQWTVCMIKREVEGCLFVCVCVCGGGDLCTFSRTTRGIFTPFR